MAVKIKPRNDILRDIIQEGKKHPKGWNAAFGKDSSSFSHDCYIFHPNIGIYLLKEYNKNPFEVKGIGSKLARRIDEDIEEQIRKKSGDFGIIQGDIRKILSNINRGIPPEKILTSAIQGDDLGLTIPVRGRASTSETTFHTLKNTFSRQQKKLDTCFEKMVSEDGLYTSYE
ncbi:MAG: hypothetical protein MUC80_08650 [Candidatus Thermoplasmatota archaeon]|jgi:hypothetical protein|nr:hypothetical protein [Candidatus Thermoplasmatota archaeon]